MPFLALDQQTKTWGVQSKCQMTYERMSFGNDRRILLNWYLALSKKGAVQTYLTNPTETLTQCSYVTHDDGCHRNALLSAWGLPYIIARQRCAPLLSKCICTSILMINWKQIVRLPLYEAGTRVKTLTLGVKEVETFTNIGNCQILMELVGHTRNYSLSNGWTWR